MPLQTRLPFHVPRVLTSDVLSQVDDLLFAVEDFNALCVSIIAHTERTRDGRCKSAETQEDGDRKCVTYAMDSAFQQL